MPSSSPISAHCALTFYYNPPFSLATWRKGKILFFFKRKKIASHDRAAALKMIMVVLMMMMVVVLMMMMVWMMLMMEVLMLMIKVVLMVMMMVLMIMMMVVLMMMVWNN